MSNFRSRFAFVLAILVSLALHVCLAIIRMPETAAIPRTVIDLETSIIVTGADDVSPSGGPPAARQDLPPNRSAETEAPPVEPQPQPPVEPQPQPPAEPQAQPPVTEAAAAETVEMPQDAQSAEPAAAEQGLVSEGAADEASPAVASSTPAVNASTPATIAPPSTGIASGGVPGGTGLPGGGTSPNESPRRGGDSPGQTSAPKEKYFIPYFKVDRLPRVIQKASLEYPKQAKRRNLEATVILEADIDEKGKLQAVRVVKPAGFGFDEAAEKYIRESRFSPAYIGENPVAVLMRFSIMFTLSD
jgi:TonB family protein